jgi:hypothetical protein
MRCINAGEPYDKVRYKVNSEVIYRRRVPTPPRCPPYHPSPSRSHRPARSWAVWHCRLPASSSRSEILGAIHRMPDDASSTGCSARVGWILMSFASCLALLRRYVWPPWFVTYPSSEGRGQPRSIEGLSGGRKVAKGQACCCKTRVVGGG